VDSPYAYPGKLAAGCELDDSAAPALEEREVGECELSDVTARGGVVAGARDTPDEAVVEPAPNDRSVSGFNSPVICNPLRIWYRRIAAPVSAFFSPLTSP